MDIPGVNENWELEVNPLMQEMQAAHREEEYFNPQEVSAVTPSHGEAGKARCECE